MNSDHKNWKWRKAGKAGALNENDPRFGEVESTWEIGDDVCGPCKGHASATPSPGDSLVDTTQQEPPPQPPAGVPPAAAPPAAAPQAAVQLPPPNGGESAPLGGGSVGAQTHTNPEMAATLATIGSAVDYATVLKSLTQMKGITIWGGSKEIYVDYTAFQSPRRLARSNAGHKDPMKAQWQAAETRAPGFLAAVEELVNGGVDRAVAHVGKAYGETRVLLLNAPSFLMHGNGGFIHQDARVEYSFLMALVPGPPTEAYAYPFGESHTNIAARALGVTEAALANSSGCDYVRQIAPLLLPHAELEASMKPAGGVILMEAGDMAVLPPGCIHRTPWMSPDGTADRAMLFFTLAPAPATGELYDPTHQVMSLDAWAKVVTHNFFPSQLTAHMDSLFACVLAASLNPKFKGTGGKQKWALYMKRISEYAPDDNMQTAKDLVAALEKAKLARDEAQKLAWATCQP